MPSEFELAKKALESSKVILFSKDIYNKTRFLYIIEKGEKLWKLH